MSQFWKQLIVSLKTKIEAVMKASFWGLLGLICGSLIFQELKFFGNYSLEAYF